MRQDGSAPDQIKLAIEFNFRHIGRSLHRMGAPVFCAKINGGGIQLAGRDFSVVMLGAKLAQYAGVAAAEIEDVGEVRFRAKSGGKLDEFEGAVAALEILFFTTGHDHRVTR